MREEFEFPSAGELIRGHLFLPKGKPLAALVLTGPLTSVKEQASGAHARALAERGFAALAFDHRYFGESGGQPRQFENPRAKVEDIRAALAALKESPHTRGLTPAAVGVCAGAGYMAAAVAEEPSFVAFAGIAGYYAEATPQSIAASQARIERGRAAERKWRETGVAETIPAVAPDAGDVGMPLREAYEFYGTPRGAVPNYVNGFAVQSFAYTTPFDANGVSRSIKVPTLVVHSENALSPPLARKFIAGLAGPHEELWLHSVGQIDFYDDPELIACAADAVAEFFRRKL
ncbi:MAG TPA: alpha/beta hydrolase [Steroidobacteraceae bacterium]|nr:alpha/beta hydrolase [Steroidobacteraceae bacterium]